MSVKRYDFDCYAFYDRARLNVNECADGDYVLHSDYESLLARHNALVEAVAALLREQNVLTSVTRSTYDPVQLMDRSEQRDKVRSARAEVDRLLEEQTK